MSQTSVSPATFSESNRSVSTNGSRAPRLLLTLAVGLAAVAGVGLAWTALSGEESGGEIILHDVRRQDMEVVVVERGQLESGKNAELFCEVEARSPGSPATSIKWIVPEGHLAKKGELLCEFDSASLQDQLTTQKVTLAKAKAALASQEADFEIVKSQNTSDIKAAETTVELAQIDLRKYLEGDYVKERRKIEGDILIAEEEVKRAKERLEYSERLNKKGYVSTSEVESDQLAVTRAENALAMAREELRVLNEYTKPRQTKDLETKRDEALRALDRVKNQAKAKEAQAQVKLLAEQATYETEEANLRKIERQLGVCKLYAPLDGMVTYANEFGRFGQQTPQVEEGASVRERQKIIRIPDLGSMQVNVKVHEAKVAHLAQGQPARIKVESMPDRPLKGTVKSVATMADSQSWMSTGVQVFTVLVAIDEQIEGLKPGMTAEVEILANRLENALPVPVQAVIERKGKSFCYVKRGRNFELIPVELGVSNEKLVAVSTGLNEGDQVVQNISSLLTESQLRSLSDQVAGSDEKKDVWAGRELPKPGADGPAGANGPRAETAAPRRPADAATKPGAGGQAGGGSFFAKYDKNGDGKVAKDEMPENLANLFAKMDTNSDGFIDQNEMAAARPRGSGGGRAATGNMPRTPADYIKAFDKDNDGKVSKDETPDQGRQFFGFVDTNGDGFADKAEIEAMYKRMEALRQSGGFGGGPPGGAPTQ
jgi:RND family efflux transporter MFP subunit